MTKEGADGTTELETKLKNADPYIKKHIAELAKENSRLQSLLVKCETKQLTLNHRIKALEDQIKDESHKPIVQVVAFGGDKNA